MSAEVSSCGSRHKGMSTQNSSNHHRICTKRQSWLESVPGTAVGALYLSNTYLYRCRLEVHVLDSSLWPVKKATLAYYPVTCFFHLNVLMFGK